LEEKRKAVMEKEVKLKIFLKVEHLFDFLLYNVYHGFFGIVSMVIILFSVVLLITGIREEGTIQKILLVAIILVFVAGVPWMLRLQAAKQLKLSPINGKSLVYEISSDGIQIKQGRNTLTNEWNEVRKVVETRKSIIVYSQRAGAFILPKHEIAEDYEALKSLLRSNTELKKCRLKNSR